MSKVKRMFWDIETSPNVGYFWRSGWKLTIPAANIIKERKIICICWKWEGKKKIHSLQWDNGNDLKMCKAFLKEANKADEMIAHNGDNFDIKWFKGQLAAYGLNPLGFVKTVDTYKIAKSNFNYNSYSLDYLSKKWFGNGKIHTSFSLWTKVMDGNKTAMKQMVKYCKRDVEVQEQVWGRLAPFYVPKTHAGVLRDRDRWTCPHDGSEDVKHDKVRVSAAGIRRYQFKCKECGRYYTVPANIYQDYLETK